MRNNVTSCILSLLIASSSMAVMPTKDVCGSYQGVLGKNLKITLQLTMRDTQFAGVYRYARYGSPIELNPEDGPAGKITLAESSSKDGDKIAAYFTGEIDDEHRFIGNWTSADGKRVLPFRLTRIAELAPFSTSAPHYSVTSTAARFTASTPFYNALNEILAKRAKDDVKTTAAEFDKMMDDFDPGFGPYESHRTAEVLYADDKLVSLCFEQYYYAGGAHGSTWYSTGIYALRDHRIVELHTEDFFEPKSKAAVISQVVRSLTRQKAGWPEDVKKMKWDHLVINPTGEGLIFTLAPYEAGSFAEGTYTVMLPYSTIPNSIKLGSDIIRFTDIDEQMDRQSRQSKGDVAAVEPK